MGQKARRKQALSAKAKAMAEHMRAYLHSLRALTNSVPEVDLASAPGFVSIGRCEIWPCNDAALVLIYQSPTNTIEVIIKDYIGTNVHDFFASSSIPALYGPSGQIGSLRAILGPKDASEMVLHFADVSVQHNNVILRPKYRRASIFGWKVPLPEPDEEALNDFRSAFVVRNVTRGEAAGLPSDEVRRLARTRAQQLSSDFRILLEKASREEELQVFLRDHPELLYPDFITCHPKFKLGEDYVTDYVLLVQGQQGIDHIFVEIERPDKQIFTEVGQFSAHFTQAKNQLLDWDNWTTKNHAYISRKL